MTLVLCKLLGVGNEPDSYRHGFPTGRLVAYSTSSRFAVVDVRDDDVPAGLPTYRFDASWFPDGPAPVVRLRAEDRDRWNAALRARYPYTHAAVDVQDLVQAAP